MSIAAIITVPDLVDAGKPSVSASAEPLIVPGSSHTLNTPMVWWEIFGQSILDHTVEQLHRDGVADISVIAEAKDNKHSGGFWFTWDRIAADYLAQGFEHLILLRLDSYSEVDIQHLVRTHRRMGNSLTQVYRGSTPLDFVLVENRRLAPGTRSFRSQLNAIIPQQRPYRSAGYFNPLAKPQDFRALVRDSLLGRTRMRPRGREVHPGIWYDKGSQIHVSARIEAPAYIGAGARISASCTVTGASSIERGCHVDCGTIIDSCCVFPGTYIGMGLHARNAVVTSSRLFHLQRNLVVPINDLRILAIVPSAPTLRAVAFARKAKTLFAYRLNTDPGLSTNSSQSASLEPTRRFRRYG